MPSATPYDRQFSFALYSAENPLVPHSGVSLDAEFNAVKVSLDETQQNLRLIQDDDGVLKRGSVGRAQFDASITIGFAAPSSWQPSTTYDAEVSTVFYASKFYICTSTHVSGPLFDPSNWEAIADFTVAAIIDDGSITSAKLANGAVDASKIGDGSISNSKIASGAVSTAKLAAQAVTFDKLGPNLPTEIANVILPAGLGPFPYSLPDLPAGWDWADGGLLLSGTAYPALRNAYIAAGFPHGQDGSGNPKKPDTRGRAVIGEDGGTNRAPGYSFGTAGGSSAFALSTFHLPPYTPSGSVSSTFNITSGPVITTGNGGGGIAGGAVLASNQPAGLLGVTFAANVTSSFTGSAQGGISTSVALFQPSIAMKSIIKAH